MSLLITAACALSLAGCGGGGSDAGAPIGFPIATAPSPATPVETFAPSTPIVPDMPAVPPVVAEPAPGGGSDNPWLRAAAGDVLRVPIDALHPTQPAVGYDQIYYHLGRKQPDPTRFAPTMAGYLGDDDNDNYSRYLYRTERKRADDYCADNGQGGVDDSRYVPWTVRLIDPSTFACKDAVPTAGSLAAALLKTVVIGPAGTLYLTDGHHTMTVLRELADGGAQLPVWVRVAANLSDAPDADAFWAKMRERQYTWLFDAQMQPITPAQLPSQVGLAKMQDDPYRSLVYFTRDLGYSNANVSEFAEFYWSAWLRGGGFSLANYAGDDLTRARVQVTGGTVSARPGDSTTSYVAAARDASLRMVALADGELIGGGRTAADLGRLSPPTAAGTWNDLMEEEIFRTDLNSTGRYRTAGKAWYAAKYRLCGSAATAPGCWLQSN